MRILETFVFSALRQAQGDNCYTLVTTVTLSLSKGGEVRIYSKNYF